MSEEIQNLVQELTQKINILINHAKESPDDYWNSSEALHCALDTLDDHLQDMCPPWVIQGHTANPQPFHTIPHNQNPYRN